MTPSEGPISGGTVIEVLGTGFVRPLTARIGEQPARGLVIHDPTRLTLVTPPGDTTGLVDVQLQGPGGVLLLGAAFRYLAELRVDAVIPERIPSTGGTLLTVVGEGFRDGALATIGGRLGPGLTVLDGETLLVHAPAGPLGPAELRVYLPDGRRAVLPEAVTYHRETRLDGVSPAAGPVTGSTRIQVRGGGFSREGWVSVGGEQAELLEVDPTGDALTARTPPGSVGPQPVVVAGEGGLVTLADAFTYYDPGQTDLQLLAGRREAGAPAGGELVTVIGAGFTVTTEVFFGLEAAACLLENPNLLTCRTPAHPAGEVDLTVRGGEATVRLPGGFTYLAELGLDAVVPDQGPAAGGTPIVVHGAGFDQQTLVRVGLLPLQAPRLLSATALAGETPPGVAGPADVVVTQAGREQRLTGGFRYTDARRVLALEPARGSVAGGTLVTITGTGLLPDCTVLFGEVPASQVTDVDGTSLQVLTPPGAEGTVDVTVLPPEGEGIRRRGAFEYFDPTTLFGGVWGEQIQGSLNVSVRNALAMDRPVAEAFVLLSTTRSSPYQGLTDESGLITFSGVDLRGRQMITAAKEGFETTSILRFDAENVTIALVPLPDPAQGEPGPGIPPARISGVVWGMDKYIPEPEGLGIVKRAFVTTTCATATSCDPPYRPDPGPGGTLGRDGPYAIDARLGDLAVIAVAGHYQELTGRFTPLRMGVHRFVFGISGVETTDVDIPVNLPLDRTARLLFDQPVGLLADLPGPNEMTCKPVIELGTEGVLPLFRYADYAGPIVELLDLPGFPELSGPLSGLGFTFETGTYTSYPEALGLYAPLSVNQTRGITDLTAPLVITPFVGVPRITSPSPLTLDLVDGALSWEILGGSALPNTQLVMIQQPSFPSPIPVWTLFVDGQTRTVPLPDLQDISGLPRGEYLQVIVLPIFADGFDFDRFEYEDYSQSTWRAYSGHWGDFFAY